jgi:hypothetical protein
LPETFDRPGTAFAARRIDTAREKAVQPGRAG